MTAGPIDVISLGAGVQSTTMALMAAAGEIEPMPVAAVFADTGAEPRAVYQHLDWLRSGVLPFPVHVVQWRDLRADIEATARGEDVANRRGGYLAPPFHTRNADRSRGMLRRECTQNYKIDPLRSQVKGLLGLPLGKPARTKGGDPLAVQWIGISLDEVHRMKPSRERWLVKRHPLLELRMTRGHCLEWLARHGYPEPPRSACTFCPYRGAREWRDLARDPEDWADAVRIDRLIRDLPAQGLAHLHRGGRLFVSSTCGPLEELDLTDPHAGQRTLFGNECEGMCGV